MADFYVKQGDDAPALVAVMTDRDNQPVNLTGATGQIFIRHTFSSTPLVTGTVTIAADQVTNKGQVSYAWPTGGLTTPGEYLVEWEILFTGGRKQTYPNGGYSILEVVPQLA